jgi:hypothetical protein
MLASPPKPGAVYATDTSSSAFGYGSGLRSTLLTTLKTAVLAPIPIASVNRAITVNVGLRRNNRSPCRMSWPTVSRNATVFIL